MDKIDSLEFARKRYSCRKPTGVPVTAEKLERILEAARVASAAHNEQPFRVFLLENLEAVEKMHEITPYIFRADCFLMVAAIPSETWVREFDQTNFATVDASIVATHIMLATKAEGLGTTWVEYFDVLRAEELFPVTTPCELITLFPIGEKAAETHLARLYEKGEPIANLVERF